MEIDKKNLPVVLAIMKDFIDYTVPNRDFLPGYLRACEKWDTIKKATVEKEIRNAIKVFRKSYWHKGTTEERELFMENRKKLQALYRQCNKWKTGGTQ